MIAEDKVYTFAEMQELLTNFYYYLHNPLIVTHKQQDFIRREIVEKAFVEVSAFLITLDIEEEFQEVLEEARKG